MQTKTVCAAISPCNKYINFKYIHIFIHLNQVALLSFLRKFTPQLKAYIKQSDVWYTGENTKLNVSIIHTIKHRKAGIVWMLQTILWELIIARRVTLMVWNGLLCAESIQYPSPQIG